MDTSSNLPKSTKEKKIRFSLSYLLTWIAACAVAVACFTTSLLGGNGWLVGYRGLILFSLGVLLAVFLIGDPLRRVVRILVWPMIATALAVCVSLAFLLWYINSFVPILVEQGLAEPGEIAFKKLRLDSDNMIILKYHVARPRDCEITCFMSLHERTGQLNYIE